MLLGRACFGWGHFTQVVVKELAERNRFAAFGLAQRDREFIGLLLGPLAVGVTQRLPDLATVSPIFREQLAGGVDKHPHSVRALLTTEVFPTILLPSAGH